MKKILFITLALIMVLSVSLIGCAGGGGGGGGAPPTAIKMGVVRDFSHFVLSFYDWFAGGPIYRAFNATELSGGIFMKVYNKTLPVEFILRDYDPQTAGDLGIQTTAVIVQQGAHFLVGGPGTTTIYTQASVSNTKNIILETMEGGATDMMRDEDKLPVWPYTFVNLAFSDWYQIPVLYAMLQDQGVSAPKAYVMYLDNEHGEEYLEVTEEIFGAGNVTAVVHSFIPEATQSDINDMVDDAMTALNASGHGPDYDVFCAFTYDPYLQKIINAFASYAFDPPAIIMGPGSEGGYYWAVNGANLTGVTVFALANNRTVIPPSQNPTMSMDDLYTTVMPYVTAGMGFPPIFAYSPWGTPTMWAAFEMWKDAVEQVGHLNAGYTDAVRAVLVSYNSTNPATTVMGDTWYRIFGNGAGGGVIDYLCMPGQLGQWQNTTGGYCGSMDVEIVGFPGINSTNWAVPPVAVGGGSPTPLPKYYVTGNWIYPMTGNWNWL